MYLRKAVLDHLPISMIEKTHTLARYMAISAPEQMDLVRISNQQTLSFVSPIVTIPTAQIGNHLPGYIDDLDLVLYERNWRFVVCSFVRCNSHYIDAQILTGHGSSFDVCH
jgi:hypothetical protein